jgi:hypothetical protein
MLLKHTEKTPDRQLSAEIRLPFELEHLPIRRVEFGRLVFVVDKVAYFDAYLLLSLRAVLQGG